MQEAFYPLSGPSYISATRISAAGPERLRDHLRSVRGRGRISCRGGDHVGVVTVLEDGQRAEREPLLVGRERDLPRLAIPVQSHCADLAVTRAEVAVVIVEPVFLAVQNLVELEPGSELVAVDGDARDAFGEGRAGPARGQRRLQAL